MRTLNAPSCLGRRLMQLYGNSAHHVVMGVYSEHRWDEWKFVQTPTEWWDHYDNQRRYFDTLRRELGLHDSMESLYRISAADILSHGGGALLTRYNWSPWAIVSSLYPEHEWLPWRFSSPPRNWWTDFSLRRKYLLWLIDLLTPSDQSYYIPSSQVDNEATGRLEKLYQLTPAFLLKHNGTFRMLSVYLYDHYYLRCNSYA